MTTTKTSKNLITVQAIIFTCFASMMYITSASASIITYTLDDIMQDNNQQLTGTFQWNYQEGDFENGTGMFTDLFIPGHGTDIDTLTINFDITKSIEFSLTQNLHNNGVNVTLFLFEALTPTSAALIDTSRSSYEIEAGQQRGGFVSGNITPMVVPVPAALWLFTSGLIGLTMIGRKKFITYKTASLFRKEAVPKDLDMT